MATTTPTRVANAKTGAGGAADAAADAAPKKSKKKLIIAAVILVVVGGGYYKFGMAKAAKADAAPVPGLVVAMDETTLNLADGHFLKIKLALQATKSAPATLDTSKAADIEIAEFTNRPLSSMVTTAERTAIKADLLKKLQVAYPKDIMDVYLTEFVMQ